MSLCERIARAIALFAAAMMILALLVTAVFSQEFAAPSPWQPGRPPIIEIGDS